MNNATKPFKDKYSYLKIMLRKSYQLQINSHHVNQIICQFIATSSKKALQQTRVVQHLRHLDDNSQFVFRNFQPVIKCLKTIRQHKVPILMQQPTVYDKGSSRSGNENSTLTIPNHNRINPIDPTNTNPSHTTA